ncbi:MarR family winged helix-turn-helix transcriptional regulator [Acinetobacter sp. TWP2-2-3]|uniref:MarR family winged helix-turn-helix transcriptional regulator n=1 Tax=unclassified Acinetobacter TaxID=196816 RepID=UPI003CEAF20E
MFNISLSETMHQLMHSYTNLLLKGIQLQKLDLSVTHIRTLKCVCHNSKSTAQSIAKHMQRDKAQITRALNDLLAAELIFKTDNPLDGRSQLLQATPKGEDVMGKLDLAEKWAVEQLTQNLKAEELALFLRVSRIMVESTVKL